MPLAYKDGQTMKVKVGILLDDLTIPAWAHTMLSEIQTSSYAAIELVIVNDTQPQPERSLFLKLKNRWKHLPSIIIRKFLWAIQKRLMERIPFSPDAFEPKDALPLLQDVPVIRVTPVQKKVSDYFRDEDIQRIQSYHLDVLIRLGFRILRGKILSAAKYGVWSYHHGDNRVNRGGPAGFWEAMESWKKTGSLLQILTEDLDNGKILYRSSSYTYNFSITHNRNYYYWKSVSFIPRKLAELHRVGEDKFLEGIFQENIHPSFYDRRLYVEPTNAELAALLRQKIFQKVHNQINNLLYVEQWRLLFSLKKDISSSFWRFEAIIPPPDRFWADPHVIFKDDRYYIYLEEYLSAAQKGHIALMIMDNQGNYTSPVTVLEKPYHLAYPFVFRWNDAVYMIPETSANGTIELYKCVEFPATWRWEMNLMENVAAVDCTVWHGHGKWWLFANMIEHAGASTNDELFLFYSEDLLTNDWTPHPLNPVVSDVKSSRPAGRLFTRNGRIYRPSQNCSQRYGYGVNLQEITRLSEQEYQEVTVSRIEPKWEKNILGVHTLTREHELTIIDALYRNNRWNHRRFNAGSDDFYGKSK